MYVVRVYEVRGRRIKEVYIHGERRTCTRMEDILVEVLPHMAGLQSVLPVYGSTRYVARSNTA